MIVFVGESPSPSGKVGFAGASMHRLKTFFDACSAPLGDHYANHVFLNVFNSWPGPDGRTHNKRGGKGSAFPMAAAKARASLVLSEIASYDADLTILLGKRVAKALGSHKDFCEGFDLVGGVTTILPHPSGVNRWWNDAERVLRLGVYLRRLI